MNPLAEEVQLHHQNEVKLVAAELSPRSRQKAVDALHESALKFAEEGKVDKAIMALEEAIRMDRVSAFLRIDLAEVVLVAEPIH